MLHVSSGPSATSTMILEVIPGAAKLLLVILAHHSTPPSMLMSSVVFDELEPP